MILQLFISFICTLIGFFVFLIPEAGALSVSTQDGIVGLSVPLRTSVSTPNQPIVFQVIKPDGSVVYLSTVTDDSGIGKIDLDHYHTTLSGKYRVSARLESSVNFGNENSFSLFPGKTSTTRSEARLSDIRIEANGENASILTVALKDDFGNAIPNHPVSVISSRSEDIISPINTNVTNSEGRVKFNIRSTSPGQSILTISDIFSIDPVNSNKYVLFERPSLTFVPSTKTSSFLNTLTGNLFADTFSSGNISLKIEAPSRVKVNEFFDITVKAITSSGTPARDYGGTILFSSDDPNADLPLEQTGYTFTGRETRPGEHTFPKATRFANKGFYELVVTDVDRPNIEAKITIEVTDNLNEVPQGTGIKILAPTSGITIGKKDVKILGTTLPNAVVGIFEDGSLESKLTTTSEGNFEFSIDNLSEGEHKFIIKLLDSNDIALMESSEIVINIDSKPPEIMNTSINPEGSVMPNTPVTITVISETGLNMIRVNIDKLIYPMEEKKESPGTYIASFPAPKEGTYPISLTLIDKNGNQSEINTNKSIIVENFTQANITNLSLKTVSKDTATIGWETSFTKEKPKNIIFEVELSKPDNTKQNFKSQGEVNEFTLTGLLPESEYNVIVRGISDNKEGPFSTPLTFKTSKPLAFENVNYSLGDGSSQIIWTTTDPTSIDKIVISYGIKDLGYIASIALDPSSKDFTIDDLIGGVNYIVKIEGMKNNVTLTSSNEISFIAAGRGLDNVSGDISGRGDCTPLEVRNLRVTENPDGSKNVIWDTIPNVDYYEIHIGSNPGENDIGIFTVGNPPFPVPFIDNDKKFHYFSVKSGCSFKKLVSDKLSQSLRVETGPALILLLLMLTISFVIGNVYYRKTI